MDQLSFLSEEPPAKPLALLGFAKDLLTSEATSHLNLYAWLKGFAPDGWFGKMSLVSCQLTTEGRLEPSLEGWRNAGMGSPTGFLTLNISECHKDAGVCSLSDILEIGDLPQQVLFERESLCGDITPVRYSGEEVAGTFHKPR